MLEAWREGESGLKALGEKAEELNKQRCARVRAERWQRVLWRGLFDEDGSIRIYPLKGHLIEGLEDRAVLSNQPKVSAKAEGVSRSSKRRRSKTQQPALFITENDQVHQDPRSHLRLNRRKGDEIARWMFLPEAISATIKT